MKGRLLHDTVIYGLAAIFSRGLSLLVLPIYTRVLSPVDYGALDIILVIGNLAALVVPLEISQALARFYGEAEGAAERRQMASTALWFTALAYAFVSLAVVAAAAPAAALLFDSATMANTVRLGAVLVALNGIFYLMQNQLRFELRSRDYAVLSTIYAVLTITLGVAFGFGLSLGLIGILIAQIAATLASVIIGAVKLRASFAFCFDGRVLRSMLAFSLPLVPSGVATFLTLYANRLMLNGLAGLDAVGMFGVAMRIAGAVALLIIGFQSALTPLIYAHYKEPETPARLARIFEGFMVIALGGCLCLGLFAPEILMLFAEARYVPAAAFVVVLAPATLLGQMYIFFPGIAIARKTHYQLAIFAITAIASIAGNWMLIASYGVAGAAIATLLSALLFLVLWAWVSQRLYPLPVRWGGTALLSVAFAAAAWGGALVQNVGLPAWAAPASKLGLIALFVASAFWARLIHVADLRSLVQRVSGRLWGQSRAGDFRP